MWNKPVNYAYHSPPAQAPTGDDSLSENGSPRNHNQVQADYASESDHERAQVSSGLGLHVTGQTAPSGGNGNGGNRHNDGAAAGAGTDTPSNDPEPAPTPAPAYTAAAYAEVVDPNYSSTDAPYRVVTSDNVVFYLSTKLVAQCPYLFQVFSTSDAPEQGYYRLLHDFEDARSLRLVLELLETRRLDAEDVAAWPPLAELGRALRLAKRLEAWAVYKLLAGCVQSKLLWQNWGRQALDVLRLAGQAGDDILARFAVEAMQRQSDSNLAATSWSPTEATDAQHLPAMLWYPGTWTPDEFDDMPRAYVYALLRAAVPAAVGYEDKANVFGQRSLGEAFAHILAIYRQRETTDRVAPSHTQPLPESPPVTLT